MTEIHFLVTEQSINDMDVADYEAFERAQDGDVKIYRLRPAICRFMVDEKNQAIPYTQALKTSEKMKLKEIKSFLEQFFNAMKGATVPNGTGSSSQPPSEAPSAGSPSPAGSE